MMKLAFLAVFLTANMAQAADYCGLTADQVKAIPAALVGTWDGTFRDAIVLQNGKPQAMPSDTAAQSMKLQLDGAKLTLAADKMFPAIAFDPVSDVQDYAVQGESALDAAEFLAPEVTQAGLKCDPASLPQLQGASPPGNIVSTFRIIGLTQDKAVLVIRSNGHGMSARAVFDLSRAPKS
jgi:hypothetical protein